MSIGDVSFYAGLLLLFMGIIGGGIEVKELKIPQITGAPRYACFASSLLCLVLGLYLKKELPGIPVTNAVNTTVASAPVNASQAQTPAVAIAPSDTPVQQRAESIQPQIAAASDKPSENTDAVIDEPQATSPDAKTINVANTTALNQQMTESNQPVASDTPAENTKAIVAKHYA